MLPTEEQFRDAAAEYGFDVAYAEKDWYSVHVLKTISAFQNR
jgi:hypothetical protein